MQLGAWVLFQGDNVR